MLTSKSKIHQINSMLITMLKFNYPNKNLFSMNAVPYFLSCKGGGGGAEGGGGTMHCLHVCPTLPLPRSLILMLKVLCPRSLVRIQK